MSMNAHKAIVPGLGPCLLAVGLGACGGSVAGEIVYTGPQFAVVYEVEPNDTAFLAQPIGSLVPGDDVLVQGSIGGVYLDPADGYAATVIGPAAIDFDLGAASPFADFDLCVYDPALGAFTSCFEDFGPFESGTIVVQSAQKPLHLVVVPFAGDGPYSLELRVSAVFPSASAPEPAAATGAVRPRAVGAGEYLRASAAELAQGGAPILGFASFLAFGGPGAMTPGRGALVIAAGQ
jgi:hypothetical protein